MPKKRPTAVLVMAILNMVFGGLALACYVCAGVGLLFIVMALNQQGAAQAKEVQQLKEVFESMGQAVPGLFPFMIGSVCFSLIMAIILVVSGIGLLGMRNWARVAALVYSVLTILGQIGSLIYRFAVMNPGIEQWQRDFLAKHPGAQPQGNPFGGNAAMNNVAEVVGTIVGLAYAVVLLVIMLSPGVVAAFRAPEGGYTENVRDEPDDDQYDRGERWGQ